MDSEFLREVEDDMRAARFRAFWQRHGSAVIGVAIAIVLGTAGGEWWKHHRHAVEAADTGALMAALDQKDSEAALANVAKTTHDGPQALAELHLADMQQQAGKQDAALATYRTLEQDTHQEEALRTLAGLLAAPGEPAQTTQPPPAKDAPFAAERREAKAWQLYRDGKPQDARALFSALAEDVNAPPSLRSRAGLMAAYLQNGA